MRKAYKILVGKPDGKRTPGRPSHGWKNNIRTNLQEIGWEIVCWIHLAQERDLWRAIVDTVMNFRVTYKVANFLTS
jgi:hypothetical protein